MRASYALIFGRGAERERLRRQALRAGLVIAADLSGMLLVTEPFTTVIVRERTAVIGRLFGADYRVVEKIDSSFERLADFGDPSSFSSRWWGNFAVFSFSEHGLGRVYRDPSGSVDVHFGLGSAQGLFLSDTLIARRLGYLSNPHIDNKFVVQWLQCPYLKSRRVGIEGFAELLPGMALRQTGNGWDEVRVFNPWKHVRRQKAGDTQDNAHALQQTVLRTIALQVDRGPVVLQLSGGLDSSIIAASLERASVEFSAVHFVTASSDGDERKFASQVANQCGAPLKIISEAELDPEFSVPEQAGFRPGPNPILGPIDRAIRSTMTDPNGLLIDGGGGDNLFCYLTTAAPVLDALRMRHPRVAMRTIAAIAERAGCTWWEVVGAAARMQIRLLRRAPWPENRTLLHPQALLRSAEIHPWLEAPHTSLEGKREHVETLVQIQHFFDRRADQRAAVLHPLICQPLLELCLSIPSWLWFEGGRDRAVARAAFEGVVPGSILERRTKGTLQGYFHRSVMRLLAKLKELLMDGELASLGILDRAAVERTFECDWQRDEMQLRLTEIAAMELFVRSWRS